jgi:hypothetical protein
MEERLDSVLAKCDAMQSSANHSPAKQRVHRKTCSATTLLSPRSRILHQPYADRDCAQTPAAERSQALSPDSRAALASRASMSPQRHRSADKRSSSPSDDRVHVRPGAALHAEPLSPRQPWPFAFPTPYTPRAPRSPASCALDTRNSPQQASPQQRAGACSACSGSPRFGCAAGAGNPQPCGCPGVASGATRQPKVDRCDVDEHIAAARDLLAEMRVSDSVWGARAGAPECTSPLDILGRVRATPLRKC